MGMAVADSMGYWLHNAMHSMGTDLAMGQITVCHTGTWKPRHIRRHWLNKLIREYVYSKSARTLYIHQIFSYIFRDDPYFTMY